jgi:hypothetical protein
LISPCRKGLRIYNNREFEFIYKKIKKIKYYKKNKKIEDILKKIVFPLIKGCYGRLKFLSVHFRINLDNTLNPVHLIGRVDNYFEGMIDEVRIWNVARTKSQIQSNMDNTLSGSETGLVAYYKFEEISGGFTVTNKTSNNYDGIFI